MMQPVGHTTLTIPTHEEGALRYRAPRPGDLDAYVAFRASARSKGVGGPYDLTSSVVSFMGLTGHWALHGFGRWIVADRDTDEALGVVGLLHPPHWPEPEIAWSLFDGAEGKGIAFQAAQFARRYAYEVLGWSSVISCVAPDNPRSLALAKRMGARPDGSFAHPDFGTLHIWRHPGPGELAA